VLGFLTSRGARTLEHPGGTLLAHLERTAATLDAWGAPAEVVLAGLAHATYGTDGFPVALASLDERPLVREVLGERAEQLVYRYGASDRPLTWPNLDQPTVPYRDRFTGQEGTIDGDDLRAYWTISVANELDLVDRVPDGASVLPLLRRGLHLLPAGAVDALERASTGARGSSPTS
jgi:hypothetical protein